MLKSISGLSEEDCNCSFESFLCLLLNFAPDINARYKYFQLNKSCPQADVTQMGLDEYILNDIMLNIDDINLKTLKYGKIYFNPFVYFYFGVFH